MRELDPAWPPGTLDSSTRTSSPSEAPYTAAASPDGPAPMTTRSCTLVWSTDSLKPRQFAICWLLGFLSTGISPGLGISTQVSHWQKFGNYPIASVHQSRDPDLYRNKGVHCAS